MRYFEFVHNLGLHAWDIPALVALVILVIMIIVHHNNQKKRDYDFEKDLEDQLDDLYSGDAKKDNSVIQE